MQTKRIANYLKNLLMATIKLSKTFKDMWYNKSEIGQPIVLRWLQNLLRSISGT